PPRAQIAPSKATLHHPHWPDASGGNGTYRSPRRSSWRLADQRPTRSHLKAEDLTSELMELGVGHRVHASDEELGVGPDGVMNGLGRQGAIGGGEYGAHHGLRTRRVGHRRAVEVLHRPAQALVGTSRRVWYHGIVEHRSREEARFDARDLDPELLRLCPQRIT